MNKRYLYVLAYTYLNCQFMFNFKKYRHKLIEINNNNNNNKKERKEDIVLFYTHLIYNLIYGHFY